MALTSRERAAAARKAKLDHIREQIQSGSLVIRKMTKAEQKKWARQQAVVEAKLTPSERTRRTAALNARRAAERRLAG